MKIIEPSARIIEDELAGLSVYQRIAYLAGVCYQREPRKTEDEAQKFCGSMIQRGHLATLEMATLHIATHPYDYVDSKYVIATELNDNIKVISGSIRAFLETADEYGSHIWNFLAEKLPLFFDDVPTPMGAVRTVRWANPDEIPWQHKHVAVRFVVNRAVSHELVRHRPCSFLQESQRYCRYDDEVVFIRPEWHTSEGDDKKKWIASRRWTRACVASESEYRFMLSCGLAPQQARAVLPNSTKTELIVYASLPQWKHMFNLRCSPAADPEMRRVMIPLEADFKAKYPEMWQG